MNERGLIGPAPQPARARELPRKAFKRASQRKLLGTSDLRKGRPLLARAMPLSKRDESQIQFMKTLKALAVSSLVLAAITLNAMAQSTAAGGPAGSPAPGAPVAAPGGTHGNPNPAPASNPNPAAAANPNPPAMANPNMTPSVQPSANTHVVPAPNTQVVPAPNTVERPGPNASVVPSANTPVVPAPNTVVRPNPTATGGSFQTNAAGAPFSP